MCQLKLAEWNDRRCHWICHPHSGLNRRANETVPDGDLSLSRADKRRRSIGTTLPRDCPSKRLGWMRVVLQWISTIKVPDSIRHWICYGVFIYAALCMPFMSDSRMLQHDAPPVHIYHQFSDWRHNTQRIKENAGKAVAGLELGTDGSASPLVFHQQTLKCPYGP